MNIALRGAKNCESQVEAIRTNRSHVMKMEVFLRIDSRESPRFAVVNRQEGFKGGFSVEAPNPNSGSFSGRFGSDSGGLTSCNSDLSPTFGLKL